MTDIDFDELDKAVNSLMGEVKDRSDQTSPKTLTISTTLKDDEQPEYSNIRQAAEKIGSETINTFVDHTQVLSEITDDEVKTLTLSETNPALAVSSPSEALSGTLETESLANPASVAVSETSAPTSVPPPPRTPSGRFMDVMHPSSDMKTASAGKAIPADSPTISRVAKTIEPPKAAPAVAMPKPSRLPAKAPESRPAPTPPRVLPPDPVQAEPPVSDLFIPTQQEIIPQTSPFLPDARAKVEKRPLGGGIQNDSGDVTDSVESDELSSYDNPYKQDNSNDTQLAPAAETAGVPEELGTDLLAIETNLADPTAYSDSLEAIPASGATVGSLTASTVHTPDTSSHTNDGAIFDTTEYHTAVAHPAKHGREWIWIVAIIVIVIICAGGAAAFYLLSAQ